MHPLDHPRGLHPGVRRHAGEDAHTTEDLTDYGAPPPAQVIAHTNLYWANHAAPGRTAAVADTAGLRFDD